MSALGRRDRRGSLYRMLLIIALCLPVILIDSATIRALIIAPLFLVYALAERLLRS
jgi:hypothetical protein